jgi:hypothetical protein
MRAGAPIYMEKGVAAPAPETSLKWLGRAREGGPTCLRHIVIGSLALLVTRYVALHIEHLLNLVES